MNKTIKILRALKIFDADNTLSLTSIGVMVILVKIAIAPTLDWATASTLMLALLNYSYKRHLNHKVSTAKVESEGKVAEIENKISELNRAFNMKNLMK